MASGLQGLPYNATWQERILLSFKEAEETCTVPLVLDYGENVPGLGINFHILMTILAAFATILCCMVSLYTTCGHLFHWVNPAEQKQIVRLVWFLPVFCISSFFALWFYDAAKYINPIPQLYNAFGIAALFYLYVVQVSPDVSAWGLFYQQAERRWPTGKVKHNRGSFNWFMLMWVLVFQLLPSQLIVTIVAEVHAATLCPLAKSNEVWSYVLNSYNFLSTGTAGTAAWLYYLRFRAHLKPKKSMTKFNVFSGIVALQVTQQYVFSEIADQKAYWPTSHVSFRDFAIGLPAFILCWECYWFSLLFLWAFHFRDYRETHLRGEATAGSLSGAFVEILDLRDIFRGVLLIFTMQEPRTPRNLQKVDPSVSQELPLTEDPCLRAGTS